MARDELRVGIVGAGFMGGRHAHNLGLRVAGARVCAVADANGARAAEIAQDCGGARTYTDGAALIADAEVDAVVIASPHATHAEYTLACIAAGKPVLCEKPLASSVEQARRVLEAEAAAGQRCVQVGFMREYDSAHREVKALVDSGRLGTAIGFRGLHENILPGAPRSVENVVTNSAVHDIHSVRWIMGTEIESVFARSVPGEAGSCRLFSALLTLSNGGLANIEVNADAGYGYVVDVEVTGSLGKAHTNGGRHATARTAGTIGEAVDQHWLERFEDAYLVEAQAWVDSVTRTAPAGPSAYDGYISLVVADACIRSVHEGRPVSIEAIAPPTLASP